MGQRSDAIIAAFVALACLCFAPAMAAWLIGLWVVLAELNRNCLSPAALPILLGGVDACPDFDTGRLIPVLAALGLALPGVAGIGLLVRSVWRGFGGARRVALMSAFVAAGFVAIALASPGLFRWGVGGPEILLVLLPALGLTTLAVLALARVGERH